MFAVSASAPDVVDLSRRSPLDDELQSARVILDEEPVAHMPAVAVDGDGPSLQRGQDGDRNQLLGQLEGTVVVGAVTHRDRQAVCPVPGPGEVVGGGLARRVGRIGPVGRRIAKDPRCCRASRRPRRCGDVQQAEARLLPGRQSVPVLGRSLKQRHRPLDVGGDEIHRAVDGAIDVRFGGEMNHRIRPRVREDPAQRPPRPGCRARSRVWFEGIERRSERFGVAGVGQQVEGDDLLAGGHQPPHHTGTDEAGSARDEYAFQPVHPFTTERFQTPYVTGSRPRTRICRYPQCSTRPGCSTWSGGRPRALTRAHLTRTVSRAPRTRAAPGPCRRPPRPAPGGAMGCRATDRSTGAPCHDSARSSH